MRRFSDYMVEAGLLGTRKLNLGVNDIAPVMAELREMFPVAGVREMKSLLFHEQQMKVTRYIMVYF